MNWLESKLGGAWLLGEEIFDNVGAAIQRVADAYTGANGLGVNSSDPYYLVNFEARSAYALRQMADETRAGLKWSKAQFDKMLPYNKAKSPLEIAVRIGGDTLFDVTIGATALTGTMRKHMGVCRKGGAKKRGMD